MISHVELIAEAAAYWQELQESGSVAFMPRDQFHMIFMLGSLRQKARESGMLIDIQTGYEYIRLVRKG